MFEYNCEIIKVYDGDTLTVRVDLGFKVSFETVLRLWGINAPELRGDNKVAGLAARNALNGLVLDRPCRIRTFKDRKEKYGRYLAIVQVLDQHGNVETVANDWMVANGFAVVASY